MFLCLKCKADEACLNFMALEEDENFRVPCPTQGCPGDLLHLDDGIAEAVVMLNEKGYPTSDSCGGHFNNCEGTLTLYVAFNKDCHPPADQLPAGFVKIGGDITGQEGDTIFFLNNPDDMSEMATAMAFREGNRSLQVFEANRALLEWVLTLPAARLEAAR